MIKDKFGKELDRWVKAGVPFLFRNEVDPNLLTVLGTLVCLCGAFAFGQGALLTGALLLWGGAMFDMVDGVVARHFDVSTAFGAFLDSTLDRLVDMAVLTGLAIHFASSGDIVTAWVAGVGLAASVLTSYTRARAEGLDIELHVGIVERGERIFIIVAGGVFGIMEIALWALAVGATITVVQRFTVARRSLDELDLARATDGASVEVAVPVAEVAPPAHAARAAQEDVEAAPVGHGAPDASSSHGEEVAHGK